MMHFVFGVKLELRALDTTFCYGTATGKFDSHFSPEKVMVRVTLPRSLSVGSTDG
jgi:hypothetical protein